MGGTELLTSWNSFFGNLYLFINMHSSLILVFFILASILYLVDEY
jgi:hypothetical protein